MNRPHNSPVLQTPHLVNLNEDPLMSECLLYYIKEGVTRSEPPLVADRWSERRGGGVSKRV